MDNGGETPALESVGSNGVEQVSSLNISDVIDAIKVADPSFLEATNTLVQPVSPAGSEFEPKPEAMFQPIQGDNRPHIKILEQPASKALRFRYECEGRSAGSIPGANSTPEHKTFPTIEICGLRGRAIAMVSCVTKDAPYRPHPHKLVGRESCNKGVCTVQVGQETSRVSFSNLGIQCVKRRDIEESLKLRKEIRVDPFKTGFDHKNQPQSIDLNAVRLCFQVFLPDENNKIRHSLPPVVSDVIYDKKAMSDLVITRLSDCSAPVSGGKKVILLCEKVAREDIAVTFFERGANDRVVWSADAQDLYVHKQVAIVFTTPHYNNMHTTDHVQAFVQLRRPTDGATSEPVSFELLPVTEGEDILKRKRQKPLSDFSRYASPSENAVYNELMIAKPTIKLEPRADKTPPHQMSSPPFQMYSPQHPSPQEPYQLWTPYPEANLPVPGSSHMTPYSTQNMQWNQQVTQHLAQHAPPSISPNMNQAMSPMNQAMSPMNQAMSPMNQAMSPQGHASPMTQHGSPMGHVSPIHMGHVSPMPMGHVSPMPMGHVSPNLVQQNMAQQGLGQQSLGQQQNMVQQQNFNQMPATNMVESTENPSITGLLLDRGYSGEFSVSGLSGLLADTEPDPLSDSLHRLTTQDFQMRHS